MSVWIISSFYSTFENIATKCYNKSKIKTESMNKKITINITSDLE